MRFALGGNYRLGSARLNVLHNGVRILALIGQHRLGSAFAQQRKRLSAVGRLPGRDDEVYGPAQLIAQQVNFRR